MKEIKIDYILQNEEIGRFTHLIFTLGDLEKTNLLKYMLEEFPRWAIIARRLSIGRKDKNGTEIYEGDVVGKEGVYQFLDREGWNPSSGNWKIIGEKSKNFTGKEVEKYIAGYELKVVEWIDSSCGFEPFSDSEDNCHHCGGGENAKDYEVIGNIYENPELLKGKE